MPTRLHQTNRAGIEFADIRLLELLPARRVAVRIQVARIGFRTVPVIAARDVAVGVCRDDGFDFAGVVRRDLLVLFECLQGEVPFRRVEALVPNLVLVEGCRRRDHRNHVIHDFGLAHLAREFRHLLDRHVRRDVLRHGVRDAE